MTHPDNLTGADVFDVPDEGLSPTDPAALVPWLRALPVGTVLLDARERAWQLRIQRMSAPPTFLLTGSTSPYRLGRPADMHSMVKHAPFRVLWTSGGTGQRRGA